MFHPTHTRKLRKPRGKSYTKTEVVLHPLNTVKKGFPSTKPSKRSTVHDHQSPMGLSCGERRGSESESFVCAGQATGIDEFCPELRQSPSADSHLQVSHPSCQQPAVMGDGQVAEPQEHNHNLQDMMENVRVLRILSEVEKAMTLPSKPPHPREHTSRYPKLILKGRASGIRASHITPYILSDEQVPHITPCLLGDSAHDQHGPDSQVPPPKAAQEIQRQPSQSDLKFNTDIFTFPRTTPGALRSKTDEPPPVAKESVESEEELHPERWDHLVQLERRAREASEEGLRKASLSLGDSAVDGPSPQSRTRKMSFLNRNRKQSSSFDQVYKKQFSISAPIKIETPTPQLEPPLKIFNPTFKLTPPGERIAELQRRKILSRSPSASSLCTNSGMPPRGKPVQRPLGPRPMAYTRAAENSLEARRMWELDSSKSPESSQKQPAQHENTNLIDCKDPTQASYTDGHSKSRREADISDYLGPSHRGIDEQYSNRDIPSDQDGEQTPTAPPPTLSQIPLTQLPDMVYYSQSAPQLTDPYEPGPRERAGSDLSAVAFNSPPQRMPSSKTVDPRRRLGTTNSIGGERRRGSRWEHEGDIPPVPPLNLERSQINSSHHSQSHSSSERANIRRVGSTQTGTGTLAQNSSTPFSICPVCHHQGPNIQYSSFPSSYKRLPPQKNVLQDQHAPIYIELPPNGSNHVSTSKTIQRTRHPAMASSPSLVPHRSQTARYEERNMIIKHLGGPDQMNDNIGAYELTRLTSRSEPDLTFRDYHFNAHYPDGEHPYVPIINTEFEATDQQNPRGEGNFRGFKRWLQGFRINPRRSRKTKGVTEN